MAPQLESEDEISEIEEVKEAFLIASTKNSPLIERKETTNVALNCDHPNFHNEINLAKCENGHKAALNMNEISSDNNLSDTNGIENITSASQVHQGPSFIQRVPIQEDQENIRPDKLKAKNKLNLKLNFNKQNEENGESSHFTKFYPATLNLPSPSKNLAAAGAAKTISKGKRDNKMRVRVSTRNGKKVSSDKIANDNKTMKENTTNQVSDELSTCCVTTSNSNAKFTLEQGPGRKNGSAGIQPCEDKTNGLSHSGSSCSNSSMESGTTIDSIIDANGESTATISEGSGKNN